METKTIAFMKRTKTRPAKMWCTEIETSLENIANHAKSYNILHNRASRHLRRIHNFLTYSSLFFGPISGICGTINITYEECKQNTVFTALAMASSFITTFLIAAIKFGNFENDSSKHSQFSARFANLEHNVRRQLTLHQAERENPLEYFGFVGSAFDNILEHSPPIPSKVSRDFLKRAHKNKLTVPDVLVIDVKKTSVSSLNKETIALETLTENENKPENKQDRPHNFYDIRKFSDGELKYELNRLLKNT